MAMNERMTAMRFPRCRGAAIAGISSIGVDGCLLDRAFTGESAGDRQASQTLSCNELSVLQSLRHPSGSGGTSQVRGTRYDQCHDTLPGHVLLPTDSAGLAPGSIWSAAVNGNLSDYPDEAQWLGGFLRHGRLRPASCQRAPYRPLGRIPRLLRGIIERQPPVLCPG